MKRSPIKSRRDKPRRKAPERVAYERQKPKAGARPTATEAAHIKRVADMPCCVPGCAAPSTVHHVTASIHGGRTTRTHKRVVPLCPMHHQKVRDPLASDPVSVEGLSHGGFFDRYGIDLLAVAERLWTESEALR